MAFSIPEPFNWDESFDVGHGATNDEHKGIFERINKLDANRGDAAVFKDLAEYVTAHFDAEEGRMKAIEGGYPEFDAHQAIHHKFLADVGAASAIDDGTIKFLKEWLVNHIMGSDMKFKGKFAE
jgi:hemerythrin